MTRYTNCSATNFGKFAEFNCCSHTVRRTHTCHLILPVPLSAYPLALQIPPSGIRQELLVIPTASSHTGTCRSVHNYVYTYVAVQAGKTVVRARKGGVSKQFGCGGRGEIISGCATLIWQHYSGIKTACDVLKPVFTQHGFTPSLIERDSKLLSPPRPL